MPTHRNKYSQSVKTRVILGRCLGSALILQASTVAIAQRPPTSVRTIAPTAATRSQSLVSNHGLDTRSGQPVSGMSGGEEAGIIGGAAAAALATALLVHHYEHKQPNSDDLLKNGPRLAENSLMSHFIVDELIGPRWPVGVDFQLQGPGNVTLDITTADNVRYHQVLTNDLNGRGITITRPEGLPNKLQSATFDIEAVSPAGSSLPPPGLRLYGMAAGPRAVGSIAIDEVTFGPPAVKMKQEAQYGFHSHSDFSNVRADFMFTGLKDKKIVVKQDNEVRLSPVAQDEHAQGALESKGTAGQHLLQIRAWRGNSGDWVVAWSPDVVILAR
jgi:hypothetical protein